MIGMSNRRVSGQSGPRQPAELDLSTPGTNLTSRAHPSDSSTPAFRVAVTATPDASRRFTDPHDPRNYTSSSSSANHAESVRIHSGSE